MFTIPKSLKTHVQRLDSLKGITGTLETQYPKVLADIAESGMPTAQYLYMALGNSKTVCSCGAPTKFLSFTKGFQTFCSIKCSSGSDTKKAKIKRTIRKKYGGQHYMKDPNVREKFRKTMVERHGVEWAMQNTDIRLKALKTMIHKYGLESRLYDEDVRQEFQRRMPEINEKRRSTWLKTLGVSNPQKRQDIFEKGQKSGHAAKQVVIKGKVFTLRGYEPTVVKDLVLAKTIKVKDIAHCADDGLSSVTYRYGGRSRVYYPDLLVKSRDILVEVKSAFTLGLNNSDGPSPLYLLTKAKLKAALEYHDKVVLCVASKTQCAYFNAKSMSYKKIQARCRELGIK